MIFATGVSEVPYKLLTSFQFQSTSLSPYVLELRMFE
jgi:hypothetical protein